MPAAKQPLFVCAIDSSHGKKGDVLEIEDLDYDNATERTKALLKPYEAPEIKKPKKLVTGKA